MRKPAYSFQDLEVYQNLYKAMISVLTKIITKLPKEEKYDLVDQMRRACKAPPALIAEGYAKKNYQKDWSKYLNDAIGECNEMIVHLSCCKDVYASQVDVKLCQELIQMYDLCGKQLYRLKESWQKRG
ncbi:MAG: four helix bundle protein [Candidatus Omnitrophica bacterium]|nr:four helix bundle protein [Candidatus Omnitrophota bacterium]